jgi:hypothetical protein
LSLTPFQLYSVQVKCPGVCPHMQTVCYMCQIGGKD